MNGRFLWRNWATLRHALQPSTHKITWENIFVGFVAASLTTYTIFLSLAITHWIRIVGAIVWVKWRHSFVLLFIGFHFTIKTPTDYDKRRPNKNSQYTINNFFSFYCRKHIVVARTNSQTNRFSILSYNFFLFLFDITKFMNTNNKRRQPAAGWSSSSSPSSSISARRSSYFMCVS